MRDLALLVADKQMDFAMRGLLGRHESLGIRRLECEITVHPRKDGGVRTDGPELLGVLRRQFRHGLMMLDWEGSGTDLDDPLELERQLDDRLRPVWDDRAKTIVLVPEVDAWIWGSDNALKPLLGWTRSEPPRAWLARQGFEFDGHGKPARPKEAIERLCMEANQPRSASLYQRITEEISLERCVDPSFLRLKRVLRVWFPDH